MRLKRVSVLVVVVALISGANTAHAQQRSDPEFQPKIERPRYPRSKGPIVAIDEAHGNFHTKSGRYGAFAKLLEADGYRVVESRQAFRTGSLKKNRVLVIANALHASNQRKWELPTPSAFSDAEIEALYRFVIEGGSLLLIADHMPFPGAADKLSRRFGVRFENGFEATKTSANEIECSRSVFKRSDKGLRPHRITDGWGEKDRVDEVATFVGSAFRIEAPKKIAYRAKPLLVLPKGAVVANPKRAWSFERDTEIKNAAGYLQGAAIRIGKGRVAVFAEAAMFTAQRSSRGGKMGFHSKGAKDNQKLLRNVMRWLAESAKG